MQSAMKMRAIMRNLAGIAERQHCAVIMIGHMNKGNGMKTLYRGLGSIDIAAIARSVLVIARDDSNPQLRYMYPVKSSLAPEGKAIAFSFKEGGELEWHGSQPINCMEVTPASSIRTTKRERAKAKMRQLLAEEDKSANEVYSALADLDIGTRTVENVKRELRIRTYRSENKWYWSLPDDLKNG